MNKLALYGSDFYNRISKDIRAELPDVKSDLAQQMTKDPYNFDFLALLPAYIILGIYSLKELNKEIRNF